MLLSSGPCFCCTTILSLAFAPTLCCDTHHTPFIHLSASVALSHSPAIALCITHHASFAPAFNAPLVIPAIAPHIMPLSSGPCFCCTSPAVAPTSCCATYHTPFIQPLFHWTTTLCSHCTIYPLLSSSPCFCCTTTHSRSLHSPMCPIGLQ